MTPSGASGRGSPDGDQLPPATDFGPLPVVVPGGQPENQRSPPAGNAATGASAASVRALTSQAIAFYFRAPVKAFFRTRVDYLAYARSIQEQQQQLKAKAGPGHSAVSNSALSSVGSGSTAVPSPASSSSSRLASFLAWARSRARASTPGILASAVRHYGWRVVPDQVLPPLVANVGVGAVLYTTYLQVLGRLHEESGRASKRVYPPPQPIDTFAAGFLAGSVQSLVAAPLDAVQARYDLGRSGAGMTGSGNPLHLSGEVRGGVEAGIGSTVGRPQSMWRFSYEKLREIGVRGIFAGWTLSLLKDGLGSAVFFSTFEYLKAQSYYRFVTWYYGSLNEDMIALLSQKRPSTHEPGQEERGLAGGSKPKVIKPHYAIEPAFLLLAGAGASVSQQVILHPLSHIQVEHWERLEMLDEHARKIRNDVGRGSGTRWRMFQAYYNAYLETWAQCVSEAEAAKIGIRRWLYRGFWWNTVRQVPSTSAGLVIFELVRRKYGFGGEEVRINRDGYDILLQ